MSITKNVFIGCLTVVVLTAVAFSTASAEIILYQDTFSRGSTETTETLNGSNPETRYNGYGASNTATWVASSIWETDGLIATATTGSSSGANAFLAFTPETGHVYTFSADILVTSTTTGHDDRWMSMGFSENASTTITYPHAAGNNLYGWGMFRIGSGDNGLWLGPNTTVANTSIGTDYGALSVELVLDTNDTLWTIECIVNGDTVYSATAFGSSNPSINFLHFGSVQTNTVTMDNVKLTVDAEIPEPSTIALLASGLIGLLAYAWRKRK